MDLSEFLTQCRTAGYYSLDSMQLIVMEANGRLSFLPKPDARPATPADFGKQPQPDAPEIPVVMAHRQSAGKRKGFAVAQQAAVCTALYNPGGAAGSVQSGQYPVGVQKRNGP